MGQMGERTMSESPHYTLELVNGLFQSFNELAFNGKLNAHIEIIDPAQTADLGYLGRFCPCTTHGESENTIALDLTQSNVATILLHECCHASLWQRGDPQWGEHGRNN
jgi:hypothetical protein